MQKRSVFYAKMGICHWCGCWKRIKRGGFCKQKQQQLQTFQFHKQKRPGSGGQFRQFDELRVKLFTPSVVKLFTPSVVKFILRFIFRKFRLLVLVQAEL